MRTCNEDGFPQQHAIPYYCRDGGETTQHRCQCVAGVFVGALHARDVTAWDPAVCDAPPPPPPPPPTSRVGVYKTTLSSASLHICGDGYDVYDSTIHTSACQEKTNCKKLNNINFILLHIKYIVQNHIHPRRMTKGRGKIGKRDLQVLETTVYRRMDAR